LQEIVEKLKNFKNKGIQISVFQQNGSLAFEARVVDVVGERVLLNRLSATKVCCGGRRKKYREVVQINQIKKIESNNVFL